MYVVCRVYVCVWLCIIYNYAIYLYGHICHVKPTPPSFFFFHFTLLHIFSCPLKTHTHNTDILKQALTQLLLYYTRFQQIIRKAWLISSSQPSHQQPAFCKDLVKIPQWYWPKLRNTHCRFGLILDFDTVGFKMDVEMEIWGWWQWQRRAHVYVCVCPIFIHTHKIK